MGLMDKVKAQATVLAQKTQETVNEGKARLDQVQAQRRADVMLRNLGALVFAERTGRATADTQAQIDKLVTDISAHESANGINLSVQPTDPAGSWGAGQGGAGGPGQPQGGGQQAGGWGSQPQSGPGQPQSGSGQPQSGPQAGPQAGPPGQFFPREADPNSPPPDTGTTQV